MEEFRSEFQAQLRSLIFPHKAQITFLSELANENISYRTLIIEGMEISH
jgi:hypothetical protein